MRGAQVTPSSGCGMAVSSPASQRGSVRTSRSAPRRGELRGERARRVVRGDGQIRRAEHRAGVDPGIHPHDADAGLDVAGEDGRGDGRGPAPARQHRAVDVDAPEPGQVEHLLRQDQAVGRDHDHVRREAGQRGLRLGGAQRARLLDRQSVGLRQLFDRPTLQASGRGPRADLPWSARRRCRSPHRSRAASDGTANSGVPMKTRRVMWDSFENAPEIT